MYPRIKNYFEDIDMNAYALGNVVTTVTDVAPSCQFHGKMALQEPQNSSGKAGSLKEHHHNMPAPAPDLTVMILLLQRYGIISEPEAKTLLLRCITQLAETVVTSPNVLERLCGGRGETFEW